jgi:hypothetical protein
MSTELRQKFVGKIYDRETADEIKALAEENGWQVLPWPQSTQMISTDEDTLVILINNDVEMQIVDVKLG